MNSKPLHDTRPPEPTEEEWKRLQARFPDYRASSYSPVEIWRLGREEMYRLHSAPLLAALAAFVDLGPSGRGDWMNEAAHKHALKCYDEARKLVAKYEGPGEPIFRAELTADEVNQISRAANDLDYAAGPGDTRREERMKQAAFDLRALANKVAGGGP